jgi:hypothetical protein
MNRYVQDSPCPGSMLRRVRVAGLLLVALAPSLGCGREFFREWANQDVSEAVFEKSRDPRWRLDMFSIEPPAMARYAAPYDPDTPPAPPDDYAAQATSPMPQWPDNRLMVPAEGTGYLDMLEAWRRDKPVPPPRSAGVGLPNVPGGAAQPAAQPNPPGTPSPSQPATNPGTGSQGMSPIQVPAGTSSNPPGSGAAPGMTPPQARLSGKDVGIRLAAYQESGIPLPTPSQTPEDRQRPPARVGEEKIQGPVIPQDPDPINQNLSAPVDARPDLPPDEYQATEEATAGMAGILVAGTIDLDEAETAGLPPNSQVYLVNPEQALKLALINNRQYQFQLENVYIASLGVTLQRFNFEPQFVAGLSPTTATSAGGIGSGVNQFFYRTKEYPGGQASTLNIGSVVGFGKVFASGGRVLADLATQVVFNFTGRNTRQPAVQSLLPISIIQPFLRGGGRAVTLEQLTLAERNLLYTIRLFAKFRQEWFTSIMAATAPISQNGGTNEPPVGYLFVIQQLQEVENDRMNVAAFERMLEVFKELVKGEASGLTQLQVDQLDQRLQAARQQYLTDLLQYRNGLDQFKWQIGLPPDVPMTLDRTVMKGFREGFLKINLWAANPKRDLKDLDIFVSQLPKLEDVIIDGRSVLRRAGIDPTYTGQSPGAEPEKLEDLLLAAERVALENRLDLMNARAQLYDAWRQIRVAANGLLGTFTVQLTNQLSTPSTTTNPLAFLEQAKQFSLVINTELPLIRLADRNNFRTQLINFERQRRTLMFAEDAIKFQIRSEIRNLQILAQTYDIQKISYVLNLRQKDQSQEQLIAPPAGAAGAGQTSQAAVQTQNLINAQGQVLQSQNTVLSTWVNYESQRLVVYRDLGIMPYDEWEAYYELFPSATSSADGDVAPAGGVGPAAGAAANPPQVVNP